MFTPPQQTGNNESDFVTVAQVKKYCPNNNISDISCADVAKGEPYKMGNKTSGDNKYMFLCGQFLDGSWGVDCHIIDVNGTCPDFKYQIKCGCDPNAGTYAFYLLTMHSLMKPCIKRTNQLNQHLLNKRKIGNIENILKYGTVLFIQVVLVNVS